MVSKDLVTYIKTQLATGVGKDALSQVLVQSGYTPKDIQDGFLAATLSANVYQATQPAPVYNLSSRRNSLKRLMFVMIPLLIFLIAGGGGAYFYFEVINNSPEKVIARMFENLKNLKSAVYSSETKISVNMDEFALPSGLPAEEPDSQSTPSANPQSSRGPVEATATIKVNGESEFTNPAGNNGSLGASVNVSIRASGVNMGFEAAAEAINIGDNVYVQVTQFPGMGFLEPNMFVNQWVRFNTKELEDQARKLNIGKKDTELSPEEEEKIRALFQNPKLFVFKKALADEKVGAVDCFHYQFNIDREQLKKMILDLAEIANSKRPTSTLTQENMQKNIDEFPAMLTIEDVDVWIGKRDSQLYKFTWAIATIYSDKLPAEIYVGLIGTMSDHNKPIVVDAPAQYKTFDEVFAPLTGSYPITYPKPQDGTNADPLATPYQREVLGASDYRLFFEELMVNFLPILQD